MNNLTEQDYAAIAGESDVRTSRSSNHSYDKPPIPKIAWVALGAVVLFAGYYLTTGDNRERKLTDPDSENFSVSSAIPPRVPPKRIEKTEEKEQKIVKIVPDPPPISTPEVSATPQILDKAPPLTPPTASVAPKDNSEEIERLRALREIEAERIRQLASDAEKLRVNRIQSPIIIFDGSEEEEKKKTDNEPTGEEG